MSDWFTGKFGPKPYVFKDPLIIYHAACRDGFCAAWVAHNFFSLDCVQSTSPPEFHAAHYGTELPVDIRDRDIFILDFSYPIDKMMALIDVARNLVVLDHHKTAQADLANIDCRHNVLITFDMERSGAGMAWDFFMNAVLGINDRPWLVNYVEDRDLWRKALENSDTINAYLGTLEFNFEVWDGLLGANKLGVPLEVLRAGQAVESKTRQYVREVLKNVMLVRFGGGEPIPIINAPQVDISELLHTLAKTPMDDGNLPMFAMGWWQRHDGIFQYSMRSVGNFDVSGLAKQYGGGGHLNAAGFQANVAVHLSWPRA